MNKYYLLRSFMKCPRKGSYRFLFELYFSSKLKESPLPPNAEFVRADVFSNRKRSDLSLGIKRKALYWWSKEEWESLMDDFVSTVEREDPTTQAQLTVVFLVKIDDKYYLTDEKLCLISDGFELLEPLFSSNSNDDIGSKKEELIKSFYDKKFYWDSTKLRYFYPRVEQESYWASAYIVKRGDRYGIISCRGKCVVPIEYIEIESFATKKTIFDFETERDVIGDTSLYLCRKCKERNYDVYDLKGNMIFEQIDELFPCEEITHHFEYDVHEASHRYTETVAVKSIHVGVSWEEYDSLLSGNDEEPIEVIYDEDYIYSIDDLTSVIKKAEAKHEPTQKAIADFESDLYYVLESDYEYLSEVPKTLLDIFVMMIETISELQDIPLEIWEGVDDVSIIETILKVRGKSVSELLSMGIEELDLSVKCYNCLHRAGITTIDQFLKLTDDEMMNIRNLGKKSRDQIAAKQNIVNQWLKEAT